MTGKAVAAMVAMMMTGAASAQVSGVPSTAPLVGSTVNQNQNNAGDWDHLNRRALDDTLDAGGTTAQAPNKSRKGGRAHAASAADITPGTAIADNAGQSIGTVDSVDGDGVVVATSAGKVKVPLNAFGKNDAGLLIGMPKAKFMAMLASAGG